MSLCTIPWLCRYWIPSNICLVIFADKLSGNLLFMDDSLLLSPPDSTSSSINHMHLGVSNSWCKETTRGCLTSFIISISVFIDWTSLIGPLFSITLHAKCWFNSLWYTRWTTPDEPLPICFRIVYVFFRSSKVISSCVSRLRRAISVTTCQQVLSKALNFHAVILC